MTPQEEIVLVQALEHRKHLALTALINAYRDGGLTAEIAFGKVGAISELTYAISEIRSDASKERKNARREQGSTVSD